MRRAEKVFLFALVSLSAAGAAWAHGGQYRTPGDIVPPWIRKGPGGAPSGPSFPSGPGSPTPRAPRPTAPGTSAPPAPHSPNTGRIVPRAKGPATRRGGVPLPDYTYTDWSSWWEFNKDPYLRLKDKIFKGADVTGNSGILRFLKGYKESTATLGPSEDALRTLVIPALKKALRETKQRDIVSSCLIALAKIGRDKDLDGVFRPWLASRDQEISETAVLSYGIAGLAKFVPDLIEIVRDTPKGRKLLGRSGGVNFRKRAFAAYALGLIAYSHKDIALKRKVFEGAKAILEKSKFANRDIPVSAIMAIRLLNPDLSDPQGLQLAAEASRCLLDYMKDENNYFQMRAHAPTAISRLLGRDKSKPGEKSGAGASDALAVTPQAKAEAIRKEAIDLMKKYLKRHKENSMILQSCVLALGEMGNPADQSLIELLEKTSKGKLSRDLQVRFFANIALGYLGSAGAREAIDFLALRLQKRGRKKDKPWVALGLGVSQAELLMRGKPATRGVGDVLVNAFRKTRNPKWRGAMAVALGLAQVSTAGLEVQRAMDGSHVPEFEGYCAVSLGLMKYKDATEDLRNLLERSVSLPILLKQAAIGLGLMGEKSVVDTLLRALREGPQNLAAQSALAMGLGFVGDRRAVPPLVDMLFDKSLTRTTRAFAAVALGIVGDKEDLPWNSKIAFGLNYRASVETLTGGAGGILDLL